MTTYYEMDGSARAVTIDPRDVREIIEKELKTARDRFSQDVLSEYDSWISSSPLPGQSTVLRGTKTEFHIIKKSK